MPELCLDSMKVLEEIQQTQAELAEAERAELDSVQRLQNSQSVQAEVLSQWQELEAQARPPLRSGQSHVQLVHPSLAKLKLFLAPSDCSFSFSHSCPFQSFYVISVSPPFFSLSALYNAELESANRKSKMLRAKREAKLADSLHGVIAQERGKTGHKATPPKSS